MAIGVPTDCFLRGEDYTSLGAPQGRKRWRGPDGRIYEWDSLHGHVEMYTPKGTHLAVLDDKGRWLKPAVKGRRIDT